MDTISHSKPKQSESQHVYQVSRAAHLDNWFRRIIQNPAKIISPYVKTGMTAIDLGSGTGFFTIPLAEAVGENGRVMAVDVQNEMLEILRRKIERTTIKTPLDFHNDLSSLVRANVKVDFVIAAYVFHELPDQEETLRSISQLLEKGGLLMIIEPDFIVSRSAFKKTVDKATRSGLKVVNTPRMFLSKSIVVIKR